MSTPVCSDFLRGQCGRGSSCKYSHHREVCRQFERGNCMRGESCRYLHGAQVPIFTGGMGANFGVGTASAYAGFGAPHASAYNAFNQVTAAYQAPVSMPPSNAFSAYAAPPNFMTNTPFQGSYPGFQGGGADRKEMTVCADWMRGRCQRPMCRYQHRKLETCSDFVRGSCTRGDSCKYIHEKELCGDFMKGRCSRGNECKFAHERVQACRDFERGSCTRGDACKFTHEGMKQAPLGGDSSNPALQELGNNVVFVADALGKESLPAEGVNTTGVEGGSKRKVREEEEENSSVKKGRVDVVEKVRVDVVEKGGSS